MLPLAGRNHFPEIPEQILGVPGAGSRFRVVLHAEYGKRPVGDAFHGIVIQIDQRYFHVVRHGVRIHGKTVVLGRNADFTRFQIFDRMVRSTVPELQLEGFRSQRVGNNLVAQADAEHGHFPNQCSYFPVNVRQRGGGCDELFFI